MAETRAVVPEKIAASTIGTGTPDDSARTIAPEIGRKTRGRMTPAGIGTESPGILMAKNPEREGYRTVQCCGREKNRIKKTEVKNALSMENEG